jgi:hypothetical protein
MHIGPSLARTLIAVSLFPPPPDQPSFTGSGKICIFEIEITAAPPPGGLLSCALHINTANTYLLDSNINEITASKADGSYTYYSSAPQGVHDIAVLGATVSKTVVGEGYWVVVNIIVGNLGDYDEVFDVTAYAGSSTIFVIHGVQLAPHAALNLMIVWNTVEYTKGLYTVSAYASPVEGESNVDNNMLMAGNVLVTIPGDVNGDHKVNLKDIFAIALAFGSTTGSARYKPNVDINGDGKINLKDYFIASKNFGQQW